MAEDDLLATVRQALAKATPGPWAWESVAEKGNEFVVGLACQEDGKPLSGRLPAGEWIEDTIIRGRVIGANESGHARFADADLIAHAPEWLAQLCTRLEQAEQERDEAYKHWRTSERLRAEDVAALEDYRKGEATALLLADALTGVLQEVVAFDAEMNLYPILDCGASGRWLVLRDKIRAQLAHPEGEKGGGK